MSNKGNVSNNISGDTMTVSADRGGSVYGGNYNGVGNSGNNENGGSRNYADLSRTPEAQVMISPYSVHPLTLELINNKWGFTFNTTELQNEVRDAFKKAINNLNDSRIKAAYYATSITNTITNTAVKAAPYLGRFAGVAVGALYPTTMGSATLTDEQYAAGRRAFENHQREQLEKSQRSSLMAVKAKEVTQSVLDTTTLASLKSVSVNVQIQDIINHDKVRQLAITTTRNKTANVPVVRAEKITKHPFSSRTDVYTASIIPGAPPVHIKMDATEIKSSGIHRGFGKDKKEDVNKNALVESYLPMSAKNTHDAIVYFEDGKHEPIYVSMTKILAKKEEERQIEETKKQEQAWLAAHPIAAAQLELYNAQREFEKVDKPYQEKRNFLNQLLSTPEGLALTDPVKHPFFYKEKEKFSDYLKTNNLYNLEFKIDNKEFIDVIKRTPMNYMGEIMKLTNKFKGAQRAIIITIYTVMSVQLIEAYEKIEKAQKELAPVLEVRNIEENNKKLAEQKLHNFGLLTRKELENIADKNGVVSAPVRYRLEQDTTASGLKSIAYKTRKENGLDQVPVRYMVHNAQLNRYEFWADDEASEPTIVWTPADPVFKFPNHTGHHIPLSILNTPLITPIPEPTGINIESFPIPEDKHPADYILVTPVPDVPPIYVYLKDSARYKPGTVTGKGQPVSGIWLEGANKDLGVPIPSHIADKLRGRTFNRFDDFREALWTEIGKDPELLKQFRASNQTLIKQGNAPFAGDTEHAGGRQVHEIHHVHQIQHGGEVYNIDNMRIVTPKLHTRIHSKK